MKAVTGVIKRNCAGRDKTKSLTKLGIDQQLRPILAQRQ
ncbi:hypothetical protein SynBIOSE41_01290 [Synechococcus sp. BIOS-E4-1]|nr:hypothetical protein SynBIOSE41_01290 [Synechococcus sp. BIOS-E4-1]